MDQRIAAEDEQAIAADPEGMVLPFAHETWFDHGVYPTDWGFTAENLTLALLAAVLVRVIARFWRWPWWRSP